MVMVMVCSLLSVSWEDSAYGIAMGYGLNSWGLISDRVKRFLLLLSVQISSGAHAASHSMGKGRGRGLFTCGQNSKGVKLTTHLSLVSDCLIAYFN
jgi:hypothetical protein